jgi:hypothetical protein
VKSTSEEAWRFSIALDGALPRPFGHPMEAHKFHVGQTVQFRTKPFYVSASLGAFEVTRQLPERDGEFEYRIKNVTEPHERVARESELSTE